MEQISVGSQIKLRVSKYIKSGAKNLKRKVSIMLGKKFKNNLRKTLIGMLLRKVSVRLYVLEVGNQKKMLRKKFLVYNLH